MEVYLELGIGILFSWIVLAIVMPIARKLSDFSLPPWQETVPKVGVIAAMTYLTQYFVGAFISGFLGYVASVIVFFAMLYKWFDIDAWAAMVIVIVSWVVRFALVVGVFWLIAQL